MKTIAEAISDLLPVRDTIVVPGLGAFVKKTIPAQVNPVANYFAMPSCDISFNADLREDNDLITNYITKENNITEEEAKHLVAAFVSDCFSRLKADQKFTIQGVGFLYYDWHGELSFNPSADMNFNSDAFGLCDFFAPSIALSKTDDVVKPENEPLQENEDTSDTMQKKEYEEEDRVIRRKVWLALTSVVVFAVLIFGLIHFKIIDIRHLIQPEEQFVIVDIPKNPQTPVNVSPTIADDTIDEPADDTLRPYTDTLQYAEKQVIEELIEEPQVAVEKANIMIVAGCFANEENAQKLVEKLKSEGYQEALSEKHGSKWFVGYGRYRNDAEAEEALRQIKSTEGGDKAWIRKDSF